jgi:cytoskeletal protein CcmA (bactofilin family)
MAIFSNKPGDPPRAAPSGDVALTVIAPGMRITGDLDGPGMVKVDGRIDGSILGARQVMIGRDGAVHGNVQAGDVVIGGVVQGTVTAQDRVELQGTSAVDGDIHTRTIVVHEGARLNGAVRMGEGSAGAAERPPVAMVR